MNYKFSYLIKVQFLGFRLHGWQKQPNIKTVHFVIDKSLKFVLNNVRFKTIGVGRTDAKVSSLGYSFQLFSDTKIYNQKFIECFNRNAPSDIRAVNIFEIKDGNFNKIQHTKEKEYHYYFSNEGKNHPYAAPFLAGFENLDIELMKSGAKLFEGEHHFHKYCSKPTEKTQFFRKIIDCTIEENTYLSANFFPSQSYVFRVKGSGFLRYQIRLMMGQLIELGIGNITLDEIRNSLKENNDRQSVKRIAPGSGLHLFDIQFDAIDDIIKT